jgi:hypothetical protein
MNVTAKINWQAANWNYLSTALSSVRQALEARSRGAGEQGSRGVWRDFLCFICVRAAL